MILDNVITIALSVLTQKEFVTCYLYQSNSCKHLGTVCFLPIQRVVDAKSYIQKRFNLFFNVEVLKNNVPLSSKQQSIYTVAQVIQLKDDGLSLFKKNKIIPPEDKKKEPIVSTIEISDEDISNEFSSKLKIPTDDEIEAASELERDMMIFFMNFVTHNRTYLNQKERQNNVTTVYGIVDVAWCRLKSKLLMNMASKLNTETSETLKWVGKINFYEYNLKILEKKMKAQNEASVLRKLEEEVYDEFKRLKTAQANLEKTFGSENSFKNKSEIDKSIDINLDDLDLDYIAKDLKSDFVIYDE